MSRYFFKRFFLLFPTIFIVSIFVFSIVRFIPGDIVEIMASEQGYGYDAEEMREILGLDQPVHTQYFDYIYNIFRFGDFGYSLWSGEAITKELADRLPVSAQLGIMALFFTICTGVPIGVISALKQDTALDYILRSYTIGGLSVPGFWLAVMFLTFSALWFQWVPPMKYVPFTESPLGSFKQMITPAFLMSIAMSAGIMRMTRTMMLEVMREDYIRTAKAKGLNYWTVVFRHALKNAMIPVVTIIGMQVTLIVGGTVIMESIFSLPGMGRYLLGAIQQRDYPVIQGVNLIICSVIITMNLLVDLTYGYLDPRIRYQ
ncbi:MAG: ABC transporter permease [Deltaproteobacteria bacterium]|nr:ABC transporter permease [Deltaproteobacteria bacterium]